MFSHNNHTSKDVNNGSASNNRVDPQLLNSPAKNSSNKHLYHNLYSSPSKKDFKTFIPPLPNNSNNTIVPLAENNNSANIHSSGNKSNSINSNTNNCNNDNDHSNSNNDTSIMADIHTSPTKPSNKVKKLKICKVCSKPIIGTLVRAMGNIYHVDCFTCYDCHKPCSDKFFAADIKIHDPNNPLDLNSTITINVPLCEYDYFKGIDLICYTCDSAIRGSYITALGRKYHSDHFFCEICHKVFESDNYYANNDKIYCHFHYSKLYAYSCQGCKCSILKQYVEISRGGKQQQWHPECFMVHKFWNVDITVDSLDLNISSIDEVSSDPDKLYKAEKSLEKLTISIWLSFSEFEESCANLISEMLHNATTNNKSNGLLVTSKLIFKVRCLFKSLESLNNFSKSNNISIDYNNPKYQNLSDLTKEPRSLTSKIMLYLTFLRDNDIEKLTITKYSQELLSLISMIAHFIKLISRVALMHALEFNKLSNSMKPTKILLNEISDHENYPKEYLNLNNVSINSNDSCSYCNESIEGDCIAFPINETTEKRWHINCFKCSKCLNNPQIQVKNLSDSAFNTYTNEILCPSCASIDVNSKQGFVLISRFMQLIYLLEIAIIRSKIVINKRERQNQSQVKQQPNENLSQQQQQSIKSQQQDQNVFKNSKPSDSYENKVNEITRRRSLREAREINNANHEIRKSVIIEAPIAWSADTEEINVNTNEKDIELPNIRDDSDEINEFIENSKKRTGIKGSMRLRVRDISSGSKHSNKRLNNKSSYNSVGSRKSSFRENHTSSNAALTANLLKNENSLTLDDIPRIVNSEQARDYRPNAFRFQKRDYSSAISTLPVPKSVKIKDDIQNNKNETIDNATGKNTTVVNTKNDAIKLEKSSTQKSVERSLSGRMKSSAISGRRYSELNNTSHEYIRHVAAFALYDLFSKEMTLDESIALIDIYKPISFWGKLFGTGHNNNPSTSSSPSSSSSSNNNEFKSGSATISGSGKGVFGVNLNTLVSKYGVESDLGIGSNKVRIPLLVDELINVMRTQDVSAEGVFRLNGNIRRLRQLVEEIDHHPDHVPNLSNETPIQLAALLKKFLRDLPIPLLTFKLYDLFLLSQRLGANNNENNNEDENIKLQRKRERILKLAYAMMPKINRDLTEVLLAFLSWVSTFANIDDDVNVGGSKMDTHNLATVITPNILYSKISLPNGGSGGVERKDGPNDSLKLLNSIGGENQFLAIEVINEMIELNDELSVIPEDLVHLYKLCGFERKLDNDKEREKDKEKDRTKSLLTKDIMSKLKNVVDSNPEVLAKF